jgi:feruloyl esterase
MTVVAKIVIEEYYAKKPDYSYFHGCSTGGQQALMEAQRYPGDYDGILCGAPANNRTHLHAMFLWTYQLGKKYAPHLFSASIQDSIVAAVAKNFYGKNGGSPNDQFINDPRMVKNYPEELKKHLSPEQIELLCRFYTGPVNPRTGEAIYTPMPWGSETVSDGLFAALNGSLRPHFYPFLWAFGKDYDLMSFDFDRDFDYLDSIMAPALNANSPDLTAFSARGGKLLMYQGTADAIVPFQDAVNYYERVVAAQGGLKKTQSFFRYFIVPGMAHCGGGRGPCNIGQGIHSPESDAGSSIFVSLIKWVEEGTAPGKIAGASCGGENLSRPVFPYPFFPHLMKGKDPTKQESYKPVKHRRGNVVKPAKKYLE